MPSTKAVVITISEAEFHEFTVALATLQINFTAHTSAQLATDALVKEHQKVLVGNGRMGLITLSRILVIIGAILAPVMTVILGTIAVALAKLAFSV